MKLYLYVNIHHTLYTDSRKQEVFFAFCTLTPIYFPIWTYFLTWRLSKQEISNETSVVFTSANKCSSLHTPREFVASFLPLQLGCFLNKKYPMKHQWFTSANKCLSLHTPKEFVASFPPCNSACPKQSTMCDWSFFTCHHHHVAGPL